MPQGDYTEEDLAGLSDTERAALLDDDQATDGDATDGDTDPEDSTSKSDDTTGAGADSGDGGKLPGDDSDAGDTGSVGDGVGTEAEGDAAAAAAAAAAAEGEGEQPAIAADPFAPTFQVGDVPDDLDEQLAALDKRFDDGDLEPADYREQSRALENIRVKAEIKSELNESSKEQAWEYAQDLFYDEGDNKVFKDDPVMKGAMDYALRELYADEAHVGSSYMEYLTKAAAAVRQRFTTSTGENLEPTDDNPPPLSEATTGGRGKDKGTVKTLGGKPAAEGTETGSEFSKLDNLEGTDLENTLATMSDAEQDRYLASQ